MSLSDWERNGWLTKHQTSPNEVRDLLQVVERDLADSASKAATAALAAAGYRASRDSHHYRVIHSLRETVGTDASAVATFDAFRKKRNITGYERVGTVSDADAATMRTLAVRLRDEVIEWLKRHHGSLVPK